MTVNLDRSRDYLRAAVDWGSSLLKMAGQHIRPGAKQSKSIGETKFDTIEFSRESCQQTLRQICIVDYDKPEDERMLCWGEEEVAQYLNDNPGCGDSVVENFKLALCDKHKDSADVARFYKALGSPVGDRANARNLWVFFIL